MKLYEKTYNKQTKEEKTKYFGGIFKIKANLFYKKKYFCGIQVYSKKNFTDNSRLAIEICNSVTMMNAVAKQHSSVFPQYKNLHRGASATIVATGPTMLYYSKIKDCIHIAVNNAYTQIIPDYWFAIDGQNISKKYTNLMKTSFIKFFGQCITPFPRHYYRSIDKSTIYHIPDCVIEASLNAHKFYFDHPSLRINRDIETQCLPDLGSCVFSAMYFAIYAGIKRIFIVGCDCQCNGYFNGARMKEEWENGSVTRKLLRGWNIFKEYVEIFHPDVELISVNPVGLRGLFRDIYTQSYLNANPELRIELGNDVEILEELEIIGV